MIETQYPNYSLSDLTVTVVKNCGRPIGTVTPVDALRGLEPITAYVASHATEGHLGDFESHDAAVATVIARHRHVTEG